MADTEKQKRLSAAFEEVTAKELELQKKPSERGAGQTQTQNTAQAENANNNSNGDNNTDYKDNTNSKPASSKQETVVVFDAMMTEIGENRARSPSEEKYIRRIDTIATTVKKNQEKRHLDKKKQLLFGPAVIWYLAVRYNAAADFTWSEYIRHFVPYPLITICAALIQVIVLILLRLDADPDEAITTTAEDTRLVQARIMAIIILTAYILMTGRNIRDFVHCIALDAILQKNKCLYAYILLPIGQGMIEAVALYISSIIVLESESVVDVFKDTVAIMFILEVDQWMGASLNMRDLGLTDESLVIDFSDDNSNFDEFVVSVVYGALLVLRLAIMIWAGMNAIVGTFTDVSIWW